MCPVLCPVDFYILWFGKAAVARVRREVAGYSEKEIANFDQGGLGLPDRDYYFREDAVSKDNRNNFQSPN